MYDPVVESKYTHLKNLLLEMKSVLVAFSGGVDSALLLSVALDVLGPERVLAVTASSATTARQEIADATSLAEKLKVPHVLFASREMELPEFVSNSADRCYACKKSRFTDMVQMAHERGIEFVADGTNSEDHADYRPGMRAVRELEIRSPLSEANLNKKEIRLLSQHLGLPTWDKPAYACLASRIPYGTPVTPESLKQVDDCEEFIRASGLAAQVRVRHHGDVARIEVPADDMTRLIEPAAARRIIDHFKQSGFKYVAVDLEGYQMGSMNRALDQGR